MIDGVAIDLKILAKNASKDLELIGPLDKLSNERLFIEFLRWDLLVNGGRHSSSWKEAFGPGLKLIRDEILRRMGGST